MPEPRLERLTHQIEELLPSWAMALVVAALHAMRGIALVVAVIVVAEVGDFRRFPDACQLMAYLGNRLHRAAGARSLTQTVSGSPKRRGRRQQIQMVRTAGHGLWVGELSCPVMSPSP
jgi:transposase